jgi:peptidoglycan/xylan/chitin deacetylase (PgdA/CDA1 family)
MLKQQGWAATIYVVTDAVGTPVYPCDGGGTLPDPITLDQLRALQDAGWDVSAHTATHPDLTTLSAADQSVQLTKARDWLVANGFSDGARFFATPYGKRNSDTVALASAIYQNLRDGSASPNRGYETPLNMNWVRNTRYGLRFQEITSLDRTTLAEFQSWVDAAIASGTWLIVVGHTVDGPTGWLTPSLFQQYVNYVASKRYQIDVMTMAAYWDRRDRSLAEFSKDTGLRRPPRVR